MATIEREQRLDRSVTQHAFHPAFDIGPYPSRTEPLAFKTEKSDLVERVDHAKPRVEFKTVDDPHLAPQPNMLGNAGRHARQRSGDGEGVRKTDRCAVPETGAAPGRCDARGRPECRNEDRAGCAGYKRGSASSRQDGSQEKERPAQTSDKIARAQRQAGRAE